MKHTLANKGVPDRKDAKEQDLEDLSREICSKKAEDPLLLSFEHVKCVIGRFCLLWRFELVWGFLKKIILLCSSLLIEAMQAEF